MDINTHTSLQIIHNYDENDYGYFCDPSKPGSPFIQNKFKVRSYSYPSDIKTINENYENYENYEKSVNKTVTKHLDKYIQIVIYSTIIISSMFVTWILSEYKFI